MAFEPDLPEPVRRVVTAERSETIRWDVRVALLGLITLYAALHKFLIPLFLQFTRLSSSPYARVDPAVIHSFLLFHAVSKRRLTRYAAFLIGMGIVMALAEIYRVATGRTAGWLAFSRLLSSIPIGAVCASALSTPEFRGLGRYAAQGALLTLIAERVLHGV